MFSTLYVSYCYVEVLARFLGVPNLGVPIILQVFIFLIILIKCYSRKIVKFTVENINRD
jgi:Na+-transporting methylmalonyl-CoA/oxaloacetate decarboxylase gamma subunit